MKNIAIFENKDLIQVSQSSDLIIDRLLDNYLDLIQNMVGKSDTTKKTYQKNVEHFFAFIQENGINSLSFGAYREALKTVDQVSAKTKNAYLSATKALLKEALKHGILPIDITGNVPQFKIPIGHVKDGVQKTELEKVLEVINQIKKEGTRLKMLALFHLFAGEGLRQMEVQQLCVEDLNFEDKYLLVRSKGQDAKETHLCMSSTMEALRDYLLFTNIQSSYIFPSKKKVNGEIQPITLRAIRKYFTCPRYGLFMKAGIVGRSVHGFRHFFATKTLDVLNGDLNKAKRRTRHKTVTTLQVYDDRRLSKLDMDKLEEGFGFNE